MAQDKKYWRDLSARKANPELVEQQDKEFKEDPFEAYLNEGADDGPARTSRRGFLKAFGFSVGSAALLAACETPVKYAIPYHNKPPEQNPSIANYYASTYFDGSNYNSMLVKVREGRPIHAEGNPSSPITPQGVSSAALASVLGLYDNNRLRKPGMPIKGEPEEANHWHKQIKEKDWASLDSEIAQKLRSAANGGKDIVILTHTVASPAMLQLFEDFKAQFPTARLVQYDSVSSSAILEAHETAFGKRALPAFKFDKADVIVGFNADYLGSWLSHTEYTTQWAKNRHFDKKHRKMSRCIQFETSMTVTGANADTRIPIRPSQEGALILTLYNKIAEGTGNQSLGGSNMETAGNYVSQAAKELLQARGKALVVSGSNDPDVQALVVGINNMLGAYGKTVDIANHCNLRKGIDSETAQFVDDMQSGQVGAVIVGQYINPVYSYPDAKKFKAAYKNVPTKIRFAELMDETGMESDYVLAANHPLESWGDCEPYKGSYSLQQPSIRSMFDTRQLEHCLLKWSGDDRDYMTYLKEYWKTNILRAAGKAGDDKWKQALHDGVHVAGAAARATAAATPDVMAGQMGAAGGGVYAQQPAGGARQPLYLGDKNAESAQNVAGKYTGSKKMELVVQESYQLGAGYQGGNPWLNETPDPISRITWDNWLSVNMADAEEKGLETGSVVKLTANKNSAEVPVLVQPGQMRGTMTLYTGYGRSILGPIQEEIGGPNAFPFVSMDGKNFKYSADGASVEPAGSYDFAMTQIQHTVVGRNVVRDTTVGEYDEYIAEYQAERKQLLDHHLVSLYPDRPSIGHQWAMAIDLNKCTGCGACVVACNAENNVPVVGKEEVRTGREMHWLRIDRYYSDVTPGNKKDELEDPDYENPEVVFQPMLCQHCDDAPCENVCPVLATVHSSEGLNQQAYNRCFGTRYCANNCPYKVRRFNWFDYTNDQKFKYNPGTEDDYNEQNKNILRFALNPDVSIRARGVMEKCSFCVQRIQLGKLEAKKEGRKLQDADVTPACAKACAAGAIVFGDINDPESKVAEMYPDQARRTWSDDRKEFNERAFHVIEEVKTRPSVSYLVKVRNKPASKNADKPEVHS